MVKESDVFTEGDKPAVINTGYNIASFCYVANHVVQINYIAM